MRSGQKNWDLKAEPFNQPINFSSFQIQLMLLKRKVYKKKQCKKREKREPNGDEEEEVYFDVS